MINHYFTNTTAESQFHCNLPLGLGRQREEEAQWCGGVAETGQTSTFYYHQHSPHSLDLIHFANASTILVSKSPIPPFFNTHSKLCPGCSPCLALILVYRNYHCKHDWLSNRWGGVGEGRADNILTHWNQSLKHTDWPTTNTTYPASLLGSVWPCGHPWFSIYFSWILPVIHVIEELTCKSPLISRS